LRDFVCEVHAATVRRNAPKVKHSFSSIMLARRGTLSGDSITRRCPAMLITEARNDEFAILTRVFATEKPTLSRPRARVFLTLDFPPEDHDRMKVLVAKAKAETLTPEEQAESEAYGVIGSLLSVLKSKARVSLKRRRDGNGRER